MRVEEILKNLIQIPSVTDSSRESEPVTYISKLLKRDGSGVEMKIIGCGSKRNLVASIGSGDPVVMLNGHFDVVPGSRKIFAPAHKNGRICGRGAVDDKGPLACLIKAFVGLSHQKLNGQLILACVCDEENFGEKGSRRLKENGIVGKYNIVAEPTNMIPVIAEKGFLRIKIKSLGKAAHAAFPERGLNAIDQIMNVNKSFNNILKGEHKLLGRPTLNLSIISGGDKINKVPDYCEAFYDIRYLPGQDSGKIMKNIVNGLGQWGRFQVEILSEGQPFDTDNQSRLVKIASRISKSKHSGVAFATDARYFAGDECVVLGPGNPKLSHQETEYISVNDLNKSVDIFKLIVLELLG